MADVFISYKREEIAWAARVAQALSEEGFSAFFDLDDDGIHAGEEWDKRLEQELAAAKCCVVLWSRASTDSANVRSEARRANGRAILVPAKINACQAPLGLDALQEAELSQWRGDRSDAQWRFLVDRGVARKVGRAGRPPPPPPPPNAPGPSSWGGPQARARDPEPQAPLDPRPRAAAPSQRESGPLFKWLMPVALIASIVLSGAIILSNVPSREGPGAAASSPPSTQVVQDTAAGAPPPQIDSFLDARTTPANTRAPVATNPASLPDFALFRECDGCPEMVVIPGGTFQMGSPAGEAGREEDEDSQSGAGGSQVRVQVPRFAIARFETTWDEWTACVSAGVCQQREDSGYGRGRRPVINVDWETETRAFISFVNGRSSGYRLPSEAEWEYAARAGTTTAFSWGNGIRPEQAQYWWSQSYNGSPTRSTNPSGTALVGSFTANPWGLFDMHGNVWEWVEDCYRDNLSGQTAAAYTTSGCSLRVLRGGSWNFIPQDLRSANRYWGNPTGRSDYVGFRLARTL